MKVSRLIERFSRLEAENVEMKARLDGHDRQLGLPVGGQRAVDAAIGRFLDSIHT